MTFWKMTSHSDGHYQEITIAEYLIELMMTDTRRLLVEGKSDSVVISKIIQEYKKARSLSNHAEPRIESAERIRGAGVRSNRSKVEQVWELVKEKRLQSKFTGFVDREFREFALDQEIKDLLSCHQVDGKLVWTRGHSIENYLFDTVILRESITTLSVAYDTRAVRLFESLLPHGISIGCAVSLACRSMLKENAGRNFGNLYERASNTLSEGVIIVSHETIIIDYDKWQPRLESALGDPQVVENLYSFYRMWTQRLTGVSSTLTRWLCHGHIGMNMLKTLYNLSLKAVADPTPTGDQELLNPKADGYRRLAVMSAIWARLAIGNDGDYPIELLEMLFPGPANEAINTETE